MFSLSLTFFWTLNWGRHILFLMASLKHLILNTITCHQEKYLFGRLGKYDNGRRKKTCPFLLALLNLIKLSFFKPNFTSFYVEVATNHQFMKKEIFRRPGKSQRLHCSTNTVVIISFIKFVRHLQCRQAKKV